MYDADGSSQLNYMISHTTVKTIRLPNAVALYISLKFLYIVFSSGEREYSVVFKV